MDSGNSSSMQSSSGGDEEYESRRPELVVPAFLNSGSGHFSPLSNPHHPSLVSHHPPSTFFDPSSNYLNSFSESQPINSLLSFDGVRPRRGLRSEPNCADLGILPGSSSSTHSMFGSQGGLNQGNSFPSSSSSMQSKPAHDHQNGARSITQSDQTSGVVKNPKKRTRASRRAPTTVLTTDTTNFRAMVQEFTGIPAPPFSGSSYSRRLDLFGSGSGMRSSHSEPIGSLYPLRPSAKRVQPTPFISSSSPSLLNNPLADASNIPNTTTNSTNAFNPSSSTSSNYQLPSDLGLLKQQPPPPQNMLNLQNQSPAVLSFQSFLQPPTLHHSLNLPGFGVKSQGSSAMPSLDELGMSHGGHVNANLGGLQSHVTAEGARLRSSDSDSNWRDRIGLNDGNIDQDLHHLRPLDGNYGNHHHNSQRVVNNSNSCKLNYSASSSDFQHDKGLENVSSRAEGTVDSWICPAE